MAECHPVGFQWVMEAKARGARIIHIDPRFTRTSALAHQHVALRAGSDIVLLGAIINRILTTESYFHEYVAAYTNAATLVHDGFTDVDDLDGLFSGYDAGTATYDQASWQYQRVDGGAPREQGGTHPSGHELGGGGAALEHAAVRRDESPADPPAALRTLHR